MRHGPIGSGSSTTLQNVRLPGTRALVEPAMLLISAAVCATCLDSTVQPDTGLNR